MTAATCRRKSTHPSPRMSEELANNISTRVYGYLKDWANPQGIVVPCFVFAEIYQTLLDPYAHLTSTQVFDLRRATASLMKERRPEIVDPAAEISKWSVTKMLDWGKKTLLKRIDFDPRTGLGKH